MKVKLTRQMIDRLCLLPRTHTVVKIPMNRRRTKLAVANVSTMKKP